MKATIVDLRYHMNEVLKALERNEAVEISYHGKVKGVIQPIKKQSQRSVGEHPLCGYLREEAAIDMDDTMQALRGSRYHDI